MNDEPAKRVHWSFWFISVVAVLWNVLGVMNFFRQMNPEAIAGLPKWMAQVINTRPVWATVAFGIAVFAGAIGSALLLLRRSQALYVLIVSAVCVVIQMIPLAAIDAEFDFFAIVLTVMPLAFGLFLIWYAWAAKQKGWLR